MFPKRPITPDTSNQAPLAQPSPWLKHTNLRSEPSAKSYTMLATDSCFLVRLSSLAAVIHNILPLLSVCVSTVSRDIVSPNTYTSKYNRITEVTDFTLESRATGDARYVNVWWENQSWGNSVAKIPLDEVYSRAMLHVSMAC